MHVFHFHSLEGLSSLKSVSVVPVSHWKRSWSSDFSASGGFAFGADWLTVDGESIRASWEEVDLFFFSKSDWCSWSSNGAIDTSGSSGNGTAGWEWWCLAINSSNTLGSMTTWLGTPVAHWKWGSASFSSNSVGTFTIANWSSSVGAVSLWDI